MYPNKLAYFIENIIIFILLSTLVVIIAGWPGVVGILCYAINLVMRFYYKKAINKMDKSLAKLTNARISTTIETFNIIKFIKANALESCYYNKLRDLRKIEVEELK